MAVHLTPEEISEIVGLDRREVLRVCVEESVPVYNGRIDKTLFVQSMIAAGRPVSDSARAALQPAG